MPKGTPINAVVLLDKPAGYSSNAVLQKVKRLFNARKAGHTGSLDPIATGLLPICFGQATKVCEYVLAADKTYVTRIKLGESTTTYDAEGDITQTREVDISDQQIDAAINAYSGDIEQIPPMYSALKRNGQPLYKLARQGVEIDRPSRMMRVYSISAERLSQTIVDITVTASSGFYVRSMAHDIGEALGCGAHVIELRRTAKQSISVENAYSLEQLENLATHNDLKQALQPIDALLEHLPRVSLDSNVSTKLLLGQQATITGGNAADLTRLYNHEQQLIALATIDSLGNINVKKRFIYDEPST